MAVTAVILYHAGVSWIPGGLLGVDVFFVISGFLITSLLVGEWARQGRISLGNFWLRRIKRLFPGLLVVLLFVVVCWGWILEDDVLSLRSDVLFALGYGANWWFTFSGQGYFQSFAAPSPVLHTWSLAVEEQFYLLWPLAVVLILRKGGRVGRWAAAGALLAAGATLSESLAGVWTDRLYYGTDTRAVPLLVGAALGAWYSSPRHSEQVTLTRRGRVLLGCGGLAAAGGVGWALARIHGQSAGLYRGGFLALALGVALIIASISLAPRGPLARLLSIPVVCYIGAISYGLYLWHWPLFLLVNHQRTGLEGGQLLALRLGLTFIASALSYHLLELPIRRGQWHLHRPTATGLVAVAAAGAAVLAVVPAPRAPAGSAIASVTKAAPPLDARLGSEPSRKAGRGTVRVLLVGDSLALTLGNALSFTEKPYGVHIDNGGLLGCGIARGNPLITVGVVSRAPNFCESWPQERYLAVQAEKPDLVALLIGRWELVDRFHNGHFEHLGEPDYDAYLSGEFDEAIRVLSSTGAHVALFTAPCVDARESSSGAPYPENDPSRLARLNELIRQAHDRHPDNTALVDFNAMICPNGRYSPQLDGVTIRASDGIHFPLAPIGPVDARLLPVLRDLAPATADGAPDLPSSGQPSR